MTNVFELLQRLSEAGITARLAGHTNVEGGVLEVATRFYEGLCYTSSGESLSPDCEDCERKRGDYLQIRSGDGDGIYGVVVLELEGWAVGTLAVFDSQWSVPAPLIHLASQHPDHASTGAINLDPLHAFGDAVAYGFGNLQVVDSVSWGDSVSENNSHNAIVRVSGLMAGNYQVIAFCEPMSKSIAESGIDMPPAQRDALIRSQHGLGHQGSYDQSSPRPRVALVLLDDVARRIVPREKQRQVNVADTDMTFLASSALSHTAPRHADAIQWNAHLAGQIGDEDQRFSWLLQGAMNGDTNLLAEANDHFGSISGRERELLALRKITTAFTLPVAQRTSIETQVEIISDLWLDHQDKLAFKSLFKYADLAFPLAFAIDNDIVDLTDKASAHIQEAFALFLSTMGVTDSGFTSLDDILNDKEDGV
jgi:hypothetical protein